MFTLFNAKYRRIRARHDRPYQPVSGGLPVSLVVIPSVGADYVEEALLSATFAARYAPDLAEIVIVTDQSAAAFHALPAKTRVAMLSDETSGGDYHYKQIFSQPPGQNAGAAAGQHRWHPDDRFGSEFAIDAAYCAA